MALSRPISRADLAYKACQILAQKNGPHPMRELFAEVGAALPLSPEQVEPSATRPDYKKFELDLAFTLSNEVRARWLVKLKGNWSLTDAGREALGRLMDAEAFHAEAFRLYKEAMRVEGPRVRGIDRESAEAAGDQLEAFLPNEEERQAVIARLAATIKLLGDRPPEIWSITLKRDSIRLNVGRLAAMTIRPGVLDLLVDEALVSDQLKATLNDATAQYSAYRDQLAWLDRIPASSWVGLQEDLAEPHAAAVRKAAEGIRRCPYLASHSPGVVEYLNEELGEEFVGPTPTASDTPSTPTLADALAAWDRSAVAGRLTEAEGVRKEIVRLFPRESWPAMPLERYALGAAPDSYCYWMEYKSSAIGSIAGGAARKHIIYKKSSGPGWYFDSAAHKDESEAWTAVRAGFVEAFEMIERGDYAAVDTIPALRSGAALRTKTAFVYFPDQFMPIYSSSHLAHFAELLGAPAPGLDAVAANRRLLDVVRSKPEFDGWTPCEVMYFLYTWADPKQRRRIVKIAPGEQARFWPDCRDGGYICVGWDEVGDLTRFATKQDFKATFAEKFGDPSKSNAGAVGRKAEEVWTLMELEPGDLVVANRGTSHILAVGTVNGDGYRWMEERPSHKHTVGVDWDESYARTIEPIARWATSTVAPISAAVYQELVGEQPGLAIEDDTLPEIAEAVERKGQAIVYGPPGTGKTYSARRFSVWWLRHKNGDPDAAMALSDPVLMNTLEEELTTSGQLRRITFHPSYSYEDFVEGYKPVKSGGHGLELELRHGVFRQICEAAHNDPTRPYLLLIDEINRGNIPKIFGELITLLEDDKRGLPAELPQSRDLFIVPRNVYILGTMNTADRSIRLLDTALRRRFAFVELMPDPSLLANSLVGPLALDTFLRELNTRIARGAGREKQIGHAYLMRGSRAVATPDEFSARFRQDILPLLQEYAYDNYAQLAEYLTPALVDVENLELRAEVLQNADQLVDVLHEAFTEGASEAPQL
jgi:5-methylcytosine-specific restriction protein B